MGGGAFPTAQRLTVEDLARYQKDLGKVFESLGLEWRMPPEVRDKTSFGDADFLVKLPVNLNSEERAQLRARLIFMVRGALGCTEPHTDHLSFLSRHRHQVDVKLVQLTTSLDLVSAVVSNGDFMWLMQRPMVGFGLFLTQENGLHFKVLPHAAFSGLPHREVLVLSKDVAEIAQFLRIPSEALDGKTSYSYQEIFEVVLASRFCDVELFTRWMESATLPGGSCNSKGKKKVLLRPMIPMFFEYFVKQKANSALPPCVEPLKTAPSHNWDSERTFHVALWVLEYFNKRSVYDAMVEEAEAYHRESAVRTAIRTKLKDSGAAAIIQKACGIPLSEIKTVFTLLREKHPDGISYLSWLSSSTEEELISSAKQALAQVNSHESACARTPTTGIK
eukprot:CAMPEP_0184513878 /NCGR_PEP_ID=MMETSP0198_2-20121128/3662_1 /TAXON_ID=1112570 /ORGANISM="Thraustochytrium sp., Strain LLF1b" /LENGTH=390 /DNA_ID=CAMNT_0026904025 /DNA_START=240 /DNA_END=1412 /DNA_ORIENTATION=+